MRCDTALSVCACAIGLECWQGGMWLFMEMAYCLHTSHHFFGVVWSGVTVAPQRRRYLF